MIPKFVPSVLQTATNFGIGTLVSAMPGQNSRTNWGPPENQLILRRIIVSPSRHRAQELKFHSAGLSNWQPNGSSVLSHVDRSCMRWALQERPRPQHRTMSQWPRLCASRTCSRLSMSAACALPLMFTTASAVYCPAGKVSADGIETGADGAVGLTDTVIASIDVRACSGPGSTATRCARASLSSSPAVSFLA